MEASIERIFGEPVLDEAAKRFGLSAGNYKKLGDFENYVYEAERNGEPCILRLTHSSHRSDADVVAELNWISYLVSEGLEIPRCYSSLSGSLTEVIKAGDSSFIACLFEKAPGHPPDFKNPEDWNPELFRSWGVLTGRMHEATSRYRVEDGDPGRSSWKDDDLLQNAKHYVQPGEEYVLRRLEEVMEYFKGLPRGADVYGLIHTDIHARNFFVDNGRITVFDFDDCANHWFVHDLAIPLYYSLSWAPAGSKEQFAREFMTSFWAGYRSAYPLPSEWLRKMPYFFKLRDITLYLVIHKKIDPATWEPPLKSWMDEIKERIRNDTPIVALDYDSLE